MACCYTGFKKFDSHCKTVKVPIFFLLVQGSLLLLYVEI